MPRTAISHLVAPSPNLLRFLRSQIGPSTTIRCAVSLCASPLQHSRALCTYPKHELKLLPAPKACGANYFTPPPGYSRQNSPRSLDPYPPQTTSILGEQKAALRRRRSSYGDGKRPLLRRLFSSHQHSSWWWRWWTGGTTSRGRQLPPLASFLDASSSSARSMKAANEPRLRCTEFNENGNVTLVNGEFKKSELIAKVRNEVILLIRTDMLIVTSTVFYHEIYERSTPLCSLIFWFDNQLYLLIYSIFESLSSTIACW